ncbi:uncharacterized protein LOC121968830 isoform X2 [Zingiber officinale]|uniref:uncharacterized protein LOC121968830 isoform X2 n=1 Tax=Zingiber officinale TaxID=94328 RepID=UPI001C4BDE54|nr:uncharacterized protein LOC121968830 isoform X2 [Zingiber officinale]
MELPVYLMDQLTTDEIVFHKSCFKCNNCKGTLTLDRIICNHFNVEVMMMMGGYNILALLDFNFLNSDGILLDILNGKWRYSETLTK